jgi:hypothetical protein
MGTDMLAADRDYGEQPSWDPFDRHDEEPVRSRRGLLLTAFGGVGWLPVPVVWIIQGPPFGATYLVQAIWLAVLVVAALVSTAVILAACIRRSWGAALVSVALAATGVAVTTRSHSQGDYIDYQYHQHRPALADLARDFRAGRLDGRLTLPPDVRSLSPSGFAYAARGVLFVQMWQDWRAESGTGLAYFADPPTGTTRITTASGDFGQPRREVGDGWWWVD